MNHSSSRRTFLVSTAAAGATLGLPSLALAQAYPDKGKPIKVIVPFPVGASVDASARAYSQAMGEILGATFVVDNRTGADGVIGLQAVKQAAPDGYTMLFTSISTQAVNPHLFKQLSYDPLKDFTPLAATLKGTLMLCVGPSMSSFKSAREFADAAKASPGKYTYASVSATTRLAGEMIGKAVGAKLLNVPYRNYADLVSDLLSGRVDMVVADLPTATSYLKQGMRPLGVVASTRIPGLPAVPTFQEQGIPGLDLVGWHGAYVPANTPVAVVATLRDAVVRAAKSKVVKDFNSNNGVEPLDLVGDQFAAFQRAEYEKWGRAAREAGLQGTL